MQPVHGTSAHASAGVVGPFGRAVVAVVRARGEAHRQTCRGAGELQLLTERLDQAAPRTLARYAERAEIALRRAADECARLRVALVSLDDAERAEGVARG